MSRPLTIAGVGVKRGETRDLRLPISETFTGEPISVPVRVQRAAKAGPTVLVTAAVHGDEINGTGVIHELLYDVPPKLIAGSVVWVPVVNIFGFDQQERYMPDKRDLNRCFPGFANGSLASRAAHALFELVVKKCDVLIDLHSAAATRTNFPNVRADLTNTGCRELARAFGCELIVDGKGPVGSLRREAVRAGVPCIILEAGEPGKFEPSMTAVGARGVTNCLKTLGVMAGEPKPPPYQTTVRKSQWVRAQMGGVLRFHVSPGALVDAGQPLASNVGVLGEQRNVLVAPHDGVVLGMTTLPVVKPGEPVVHLAKPGRSLAAIRRALDAADRHLGDRVRRELATNVNVTDA